MSDASSSMRSFSFMIFRHSFINIRSCSLCYKVTSHWSRRYSCGFTPTSKPRLAVYTKNGFPCRRASTYEDPSLPYMCFRIAMIQSTAFIFTVYIVLKQIELLSLIASLRRQTQLMQQTTLLHLPIFVGISTFQEWLFHSNCTDEEGRHRHSFAIAYDLMQIVDKPRRVPDVFGQFPSLHSPLGSSDHCLIQVKIEAKCNLGTFKEDTYFWK